MIPDELKRTLGPAGYMLYVKKIHETETVAFLNEKGFVKYEPRSGTTTFKELHRGITRCDWSGDDFVDGDEIVMIWRVDNQEMEEHNKLLNPA